MTRKERSAGVVVYRVEADGARHYLLLDYGGHWDFAKGHVEKGETDLAAAVRELREETGIHDARLTDGFEHEITYFFRDRKKGLVRKTVIFFLAATHTKGGDIVLSQEHEGFAFLPFNEALKKTTYPNARQVLKLAEEKLRTQCQSPKDDSLSPPHVKG